MAAKKQFSSIKTKVEGTLGKIDFDNIDFGEVIMDDETKDFKLTIDKDIDELLTYLQSFITEIESNAEAYKNNKVNEKIMETLKSDTSQAQALRNIFKNNNDTHQE